MPRKLDRVKAVPLARELKAQVLAARQLTATIGIASNKLPAKTASDHKKPDGLTVITDHERVAFLRPLPARALYGVGKVTEQVLNGAGIGTVGDLQGCTGDLRAGWLFWAEAHSIFLRRGRSMAGDFQQRKKWFSLD